MRKLSIIKMKDKYVVIFEESTLFGMFKFYYGITPDFDRTSALDSFSEFVYRDCGVPEYLQAENILEGYFNYLTSIGYKVEVKNEQLD